MKMNIDQNAEHSMLGKVAEYVNEYTPSLLFPISRAANRKEIGIINTLPFYGADYWNAYEFSWLDLKGKPKVAIVEIQVPCDSENIVESKSLKLYLNSFSQTQFAGDARVSEIISKDLSAVIGDAVRVRLHKLQAQQNLQFVKLAALCLDDLEVEVDVYLPDATLLETEKAIIEETVTSDLLKTNCPITAQPDWGSLVIHYLGPRIKHHSLLKYIVSFRNHQDFHEHCVERIFMDLLNQCNPEKLTVYARYTRRGGIDINPFRSNFAHTIANERFVRQ